MTFLSQIDNHAQRNQARLSIRKMDCLESRNHAMRHGYFRLSKQRLNGSAFQHRIMNMLCKDGIRIVQLRLHG
jgi:hypothetical protein